MSVLMFSLHYAHMQHVFSYSWKMYSIVCLSLLQASIHTPYRVVFYFLPPVESAATLWSVDRCTNRLPQPADRLYNGLLYSPSLRNCWSVIGNQGAMYFAVCMTTNKSCWTSNIYFDLHILSIDAHLRFPIQNRVVGRSLETLLRYLVLIRRFCLVTRRRTKWGGRRWWWRRTAGVVSSRTSSSTWRRVIGWKTTVTSSTATNSSTFAVFTKVRFFVLATSNTGVRGGIWTLSPRWILRSNATTDWISLGLPWGVQSEAFVCFCSAV